jgi:hypothetical protein
MTTNDIAVFVEPITYHFREDQLFERHPYAGSYYEPWLAIRDAFAPYGIEVHTADYLAKGEHVRAANAYFSIGNLKNYRRVAERTDTVLSALFHFEAPIIHPNVYRETPEASRFFRRIYSYSTNAGLEPFGCGDVELRPFRIPEPRSEVFEELWNQPRQKFLTIITQNKVPPLSTNELYSERLRALDFFSRTDEIDLYGLGWDQLPFRIGERRLPPQLVRAGRYVRERLPFGRLHPQQDLIRKVYRGPVDSKHETLAQYTFALTYENQILDGWINEKIFDAMLVGTVPIYVGAPDVTDWIPEECFVDLRKFADYAELREYLHSLGPREIQQYRESARDFLASPDFYPFSPQAFAQLFVDAVVEDLGIELAAATA